MKIKVSVSMCGVPKSYENPIIITAEVPPEIADAPMPYRNKCIRRWLDENLASMIDYDFEAIE